MKRRLFAAGAENRRLCEASGGGIWEPDVKDYWLFSFWALYAASTLRASSGLSVVT